MDKKRDDDTRIEGIRIELECLAAGLMVSDLARTCRERSMPVWKISKAEIVAMKARTREEAERRLNRLGARQRAAPPQGSNCS